MGMIVRVFGCDKCGHQWDLLQDSGDPPPVACPACSKKKRKRESIPATKAMGKRLKSKSIDGVYRALEEGSAFRAEKAGNKNLKITDMKSNVKPGEIAAKRIDNEVSRMQAQHGGPWQGGISTGSLTTKSLIEQTKASDGRWAIDAVRESHRAGVLPSVSVGNLAGLREIANKRGTRRSR